jgi:hypothetical protein
MAGTPGSGSSTDATVDLVEPLVGVEDLLKRGEGGGSGREPSNGALTTVEQGTAVGGADVGLGGSGRVQTQSR